MHTCKECVSLNVSISYFSLYMVIDLKVMFPRGFFFEFAKVTFLFAKVSRNYNHFGIGEGRRRAPENFGLVLVQLPVWWCFWTPCPSWVAAELPKVRLRDSQTKCSSQVSKSEPLREPNTKARVFAFPSMRPQLLAGVCE
jgi:hypothetical protein